jgi:hypothetical protein
MNVGDVMTRVRRTFGDESSVQITDQDIIRWINDAQEHIVLNNEGLMETKASADIVANQSDYNVPADFNILRSLAYKGIRLKSYSFNEFNEYITGFQSAPDLQQYGPGIPICYMVWNQVITIFPTPAQSVGNGLTIFYIKHPAPVATTADSLSLPLQYHNVIVDYCLQQAYELDEDDGKASRKEQQFTNKVQQLNDRNKWTAQEYYPSVTILPDDASYGYYGY